MVLLVGQIVSQYAILISPVFTNCFPCIADHTAFVVPICIGLLSFPGTCPPPAGWFGLIGWATLARDRCLWVLTQLEIHPGWANIFFRRVISQWPLVVAPVAVDINVVAGVVAGRNFIRKRFTVMSWKPGIL